MEKQIVIEANSIEGAREKAVCQLPKGFKIASEKIIRNNETLTAEARDKTVEGAIAKLQEKIPPDAETFKPQVLQQPGEGQIIEKEIEAIDKKAVLDSVIQEFEDFNEVKEIELLRNGSKGLLGFGKRLPLFKIKVVVSQSAKVKIIYREKTKVQFSFEPKSLSDALFDGDTSEVRMMLESSKPPIDLKDEGGYTLLMTAALYGHIGIIKLLLSMDADINAATTWGATALTRAAQDGKPEIVKFLLANGANVNSTEYDGYTALSRAAMNGYSQIVKMLLLKGADVTIPTKHGHTALTLAEENCHYQVVALLQNHIQQGARGES